MSDIVDRLKAIGNTELSCPLNIVAIQKSVVDYMTDVDTVANAAANEIDRLRAELANLQARDIHTCWAECQRPMCVMRRERDRAVAELAEANRRLADVVHAYEGQAAELAEAKAQRVPDDVVRDAERYRFLCDEMVANGSASRLLSDLVFVAWGANKETVDINIDKEIDVADMLSDAEHDADVSVSGDGDIESATLGSANSNCQALELLIEARDILYHSVGSDIKVDGDRHKILKRIDAIFAEVKKDVCER